MEWFSRIKKAQVVDERDIVEESALNAPIVKPDVNGPSVWRNRKAPQGKIRPKHKNKSKS